MPGDSFIALPVVAVTIKRALVKPKTSRIMTGFCVGIGQALVS